MFLKETDGRQKKSQLIWINLSPLAWKGEFYLVLTQFSHLIFLQISSCPASEMKTEFNTNKVLWNKFRGKLEWNELRIFLGEKGNEAGRGSLPMTGLRVALIIALLEILNIIICMGFQIPKRMKYLNPSLPLYHLFKSTNFRTFLCYLLSSHRLKHILWLCFQ